MEGSNGIVPTLPLNGGNGFGFGDSGEWIFGLIFLAAMMNGNWFGGNGGNQVATTDFVSSEFIKSSIGDLNTNVNNGFANTNSNISNGFAGTNANINNGFARTNDNVCDLKTAVLTGDMGLGNQILENRYANQLAECQTQRDILTQTNELNTNLLTTALQGQAHLDSCCCDLKAQGIENTQKIIDVLNNNTINDLREKLNEAQTVISNQAIESSIINSVRPYPVPSYLVSSPYQSLYNGFGWGNGFYGNGFFGNTIV